MALTNYTELQSAIESRLGRGDLAGIIPDFISLAETRLNRTLRTAGMESATTLTCTSGTQTVALPSDFLGLRSISVSGSPNRNLEYIAPDVADRTFSAANSKPYTYTIIGSNLYLYYTPDSDYTLNLYYYAKPTALSDSNLTNYFTDSCMDALVYATLIEASLHIKDDAAMARWVGLYERSIDDIRSADMQDRWSGSLRTRAI